MSGNRKPALGMKEADMKKWYGFAFMFAVLVYVFLPNLNRTHYGISEGFYYMETEEVQPRTYIHYTMKGKGVEFVLGAENVSFSHYGEVVLDGRVNAKAKNGGTYVFEVLDNETIKYSQKKSTGDILALPEGAIFKYYNMESDHN